MPRLLIVDDEQDIREFAANFFKKRDITVATASNGNDALGILSKDSFDLVLLDVRMEEMTGIEVLRKLREDANNVKVVMVTAVDDEEILRQVQQLGIAGYIHKPLVLEELEKVVLKELKGA